MAALHSNTVVVTLNLSACHVKDSGAKLIASLFRNNRHLEQVYLSDNSISDEGARMLCDALQFQSSISFLGRWCFVAHLSDCMQICPITTSHPRAPGF